MREGPLPATYIVAMGCTASVASVQALAPEDGAARHLKVAWLKYTGCTSLVSLVRTGLCTRHSEFCFQSLPSLRLILVLQHKFIMERTLPDKLKLSIAEKIENKLFSKVTWRSAVLAACGLGFLNCTAFSKPGPCSN